MSKFKGTKRIWNLSDIKSKHPIEHVIFDGNQFAIVQGDDRKANALLISKAPEMLEMLKRCKEYISVSGMSGLDRFEIMDDIEKLIKEATEI